MAYNLLRLSADVRRIIGHVMVLESKELAHVEELLREEPIMQVLTGGDISGAHLYRWRHIRDYTLRQDDGRIGSPAVLVAMDETENVDGLREALYEENLKYLIESRRIIAAGPMHVATKDKDDPASVGVGDLIMFNARSRQEAIEFVEALPYAEAGLYSDMRVHFYNQLDITGKFVSEDPMRDAPCSQMQEALEVWGYPTGDDQTPWLNF